MNKEFINNRAFLAGMSAISLVGLFFTALIDYRGISTHGGYIIFGLPVVGWLIFWLLEKAGIFE